MSMTIDEAIQHCERVAGCEIQGAACGKRWSWRGLPVEIVEQHGGGWAGLANGAYDRIRITAATIPELEQALRESGAVEEIALNCPLCSGEAQLFLNAPDVFQVVCTCCKMRGPEQATGHVARSTFLAIRMEVAK